MEHVDVFAPGVDMYSTTPDNNYRKAQGTSMAAPVVAGVAAVLRSYFPKLSAQQVKDIIMQSSEKQSGKVYLPGAAGELTTFSELCVTGGMLNAYNAVQLAKETKGKKKKVKTKKGSSKTTKQPAAMP